MNTKESVTIEVENQSQKNLLIHELIGQFSDGKWENSNNESWKLIDENKIHITGKLQTSGTKCYYNYRGGCRAWKHWSCNNKELLECVGDRMLGFAKLGRSGYEFPTYVGYFIEELCTIDSDGKNLKEVTVQHIMDKIEQLKDTAARDNGDYYDRKYKQVKEFFDGQEEQIALILSSADYQMKEMRKDLKAITCALKNHVGRIEQAA